jgi:ABC-type multidrug transport system fused ATPase/permease subunit
MAFFDTTPIGRILNRFGKDVDVVDTVLPINIRYFIQCLTMVLATLVTICISTWLFGAVIGPLFLFYYFTLVTLTSIPSRIITYPLQRLYVPMSRQLKRLESSHRSPIYSHFGESIQGAPSIRAFGRQLDFYAQMVGE